MPSKPGRLGEKQRQKPRGAAAPAGRAAKAVRAAVSPRQRLGRVLRAAKLKAPASRRGGAAWDSAREAQRTEAQRREAQCPEDGEKAMAAISRVIERSRCPISQQLLIDPVMAEDGTIYERKCIERWLREKKASPVTNAPMGRRLVPALAARQAVGDLVEEGFVDPETTLNFFLDRGRLRSARAAGGPELEAAQMDLQRALALAATPGQRKMIEFQIKAVAWMQEGPRLVAEARGLHSEGSGIERNTEGQVTTDLDAQGLNSWMIEFADATREVVLTPLMEGRRMTEWIRLPRGSRVKVLSNPEELERLCERAAPGAEGPVRWNLDMSSWAGSICIVDHTGRRALKDYVLRREGSSEDRSFQFPFDALFLLSAADGVGSNVSEQSDSYSESE